MKTRLRLVAVLAAAFVLSGSFPASAAEAPLAAEDEITKQEDETAWPIPDEAPEFHARIVYRSGDYTVTGTFTDFTPDIMRIDTLYSLDGVSWQTAVGGDWWLDQSLLSGDGDENELSGLQNQTCLLGYYEPLKSYRTGETDRFYVKLLITKNNGLSYESQTAAFSREDVQPVPEGITPQANFSPDIIELERNPCRVYAKYQITVSANATAEDIYALLPDTLPVQIDLTYGSHNSNIYASGVVDCPVTWKPLSLPPLSADESITISDAAEDILVPGGTLLSTPLGIFQLDEPLDLCYEPYSTGEVRLVLNVGSEAGNPTGVLREGLNGLEIAFNHKPTGAVSIRAYVLAEGETAWTELSGLSLPEDFSQPSTANSGYALVLRNDQEPYRSYLEAAAAGTSPAPFFVCLKIEGGVYDAGQLILAWPDTYEALPELPEVGGSGGNEGNAGADNKDDSTEGGQRPNLPQSPDDNQEEAGQLQDADGAQDKPPASLDSDDDTDNTTNTQPPNPDSDDSHDEPQEVTGSDGSQDEPQTAPDSDGNQGEPQTAAGSDDNQGGQSPSPDLNDTGQTQQAIPAHTPETAFTLPGAQSLPGQRTNPAYTTPDTTDASVADNNDSTTDAPPVIQAAANITVGESIPTLSDAKTAADADAKKDSRTPLLPVTAVIAAAAWIGAVVCKATGFRLFHRIAGKIRNIPH